MLSHIIFSCIDLEPIFEIHDVEETLFIILQSLDC